MLFLFFIARMMKNKQHTTLIARNTVAAETTFIGVILSSITGIVNYKSSVIHRFSIMNNKKTEPDILVIHLVLLAYFSNPLPIEIKLIGFKERLRRRSF